MMMETMNGSDSTQSTVSSIGGRYLVNRGLGKRYVWPEYPLTTLFRLVRFPLSSDFDDATNDINHPIPPFVFVPTTMSTNPGGRRAGKGNYGKEETKHMLDLMEIILPIGPDEWQQVVDMHAVVYRDVDSIRRKWSTLHRKQIPTGDPNMPDDVRQAKRIKYKIGNKANIGDTEEEYNLQDGFQKTGEALAYLTQDTATGTQGTEVPTQSTENVVVPPLPPRPPSVPAIPSPAPTQVYVPTPNRPTKRSYSRSTGSSVNFVESFHMNLLQQQEDSKMMMAAITAVAQGIASAFGAQPPKKKNKKTKSGNYTDSSNSDEESI